MEQQTTSPPTQFPLLSQDELFDSPETGLGDQVPLQSREVTALVATSLPEEQEAHEVRMALQQETLRLREKSLSTPTIIRPAGLTLLNLPPEILTHILLHLPSTSVAICQGVNHHLYILISKSIELQYHIHLGVSGLVDNPHCDLSVAERLSRLLARERRWEELDFDFHKVVDITFPFKYSTATLSAGVFGGFAAEKCRYIRIPSTATEEVKWREIRTKQTIIIDTPGFYEPDLHVLVTAQPRIVYTNTAEPRAVHDIRVHLNQLSTGEPHPDVRRATISFTTREELEEPVVFMRYAGNNIVLVLRDRRGRNEPNDQVLVYEWRSGELNFTFSAPRKSYRYPLFLTTHIFLLPNTKTGELEYWNIPKTPSEATPNHPFFLLSLPRLRSGHIFQSVTPFAEPNLKSYSGSRPFYANPQHAIVFFYVTIWSFWSAGLSHFRLFIHRSSLIGCLDKFSTYTSLDGRPKPVPYEEWGPSACRWIDDHQGPWLETTFGQRYIMPPPRTRVERAPLTVFNFNPMDVARVLAAEKQLGVDALDGDDRNTALMEENECRHEERGQRVPSQAPEPGALGVLSDPSTGENDLPREPRPLAQAVVRPMNPLRDPDGCFENIVYSSLPYTVRSSLEKYSFDGLIPGEECILGVQEDYNRQIREIQIFHYG